MNRMQKVSLWIVVWITAGFVASAVAIAVLYLKVGMPKAMSGVGLLGIAGLGGLGPLIFKKDKGKVTCDERDKLINRYAALAGFATAYLVTGLACMIPFTILGAQATIPITWLPMIFMAAGLTSFFVHSIAILVQYGREGKGKKS
jgi:tagatose-1,6-bisphosphate aldolase non-catalytic subunit AgaZ/GatZ